MDEMKLQKALEIMEERFGHDSLIALATVDDTMPYVRTVNTYYEDKSFYVITHALSNKIKHVQKNSVVSICGEWFTAHGIITVIQMRLILLKICWRLYYNPA